SKKKLRARRCRHCRRKINLEQNKQAARTSFARFKVATNSFRDKKTSCFSASAKRKSPDPRTGVVRKIRRCAIIRIRKHRSCRSYRVILKTFAKKKARSKNNWRRCSASTEKATRCLRRIPKALCAKFIKRSITFRENFRDAIRSRIAFFS